MLIERSRHWDRLADLADDLGVTTHHLRYLRKGERKPSRSLAAKLEKLMGIPMNAWGDS